MDSSTEICLSEHIYAGRRPSHISGVPGTKTMILSFLPVMPFASSWTSNALLLTCRFSIYVSPYNQPFVYAWHLSGQGVSTCTSHARTESRVPSCIDLLELIFTTGWEAPLPASILRRRVVGKTAPTAYLSMYLDSLYKGCQFSRTLR